LNKRYAPLLVLLLLFLPLADSLATGGQPEEAATSWEQIDDYVQAEMEHAGIPGLSLAVVERDRIIYLQGYGNADRNGRAVTPQTPFIIGSIGKTFTALAIQQLAGEDLVDLDAPVQRYVPSFTLADPEAAAQITLQHLLDHTSGLPKAAGEQAYQLDPHYTTAELVRKASDVAPNRPVGAAYEYCNLNYLLLGLVVEAASRQSYTDYVREHIWWPLDMAHTTFSEEAAEGLATGYRTVYGLRLPAAAPFPPGMIPSGYAISTAEDLANYLVAYLNAGHYGAETVLDSAGYHDIYWNRLPASGSDIETSQSGGTLNYNADIHVLPAQGVAVAVLTNTRHLWDDVLPVTTAASIAGSIARQIAGLPVPEAPPLSLWQSYLLLDVVAFSLALLALFRLWRVIRARQVPGHNGRAFVSLGLDAGLAALLLAGIPALSGQGWDYLLRAQPDLAGLVFGAGLLLVLASLITAARLFNARDVRAPGVPAPAGVMKVESSQKQGRAT
jgi:CubicO group peptidase (beta-lactamase class C family)